jgi:hypothetical protein
MTKVVIGWLAKDVPADERIVTGGLTNCSQPALRYCVKKRAIGETA